MAVACGNRQTWKKNRVASCNTDAIEINLIDGWMDGLIDCLINWLIDWLTDWLTDGPDPIQCNPWMYPIHVQLLFRVHSLNHSDNDVFFFDFFRLSQRPATNINWTITISETVHYSVILLTEPISVDDVNANGNLYGASTALISQHWAHHAIVPCKENRC